MSRSRSEPATVLVADPNPAFRRALCDWVHSRRGLRLAAGVADGRRALAEAARLSPALVLLDAFLPIEDGFEVTRRLKRAANPPWVVLLSVHEGHAIETEALEAGADAYLPKARLGEALDDILLLLRSGGGEAERAGRRKRRRPRTDRGAGSEPSLERRSRRAFAWGALGAAAARAGAWLAWIWKRTAASRHGGRWETQRRNTMRVRHLATFAVALVLAAAPAVAERIVFEPIEGTDFLVPTDITADGSKILLSGFFGGPYFTWTEEEGLVPLGGDACSGSPRMSADGSVIVANKRDDGGVCQAAKYLGDQQWQLMGSEPGALPCGTSLSSSYDTNETMAVGLFWRAQRCRAIGGTWDVVAGVAGPELPSTVPNRPTRGNGVTADGNVVVGWQDDEFGSRNGVKWVNFVQEYILTDDGRRNGEALAVNADGSAIVGTSFGFDGTGLGWLWRDGQGMISFGVGGIGRNVRTIPGAVSDDGDTVVGFGVDFDNFIRRAFIWTEKKGFEFLDEFLKGRRADGWSLEVASAVSSDGSVIAGWGFNPDGTAQAFIVRRGVKGQP